MKIYNTLSKSIEEFQPLQPGQVSMYSCGPTVYDYQHIGHMRRYVGDDLLIRVLKLNGYAVHHVMNITDVGHLVSDADSGEDKMEKGAKKFGKSVWEIAKMFEEQFKDSCGALNISLPIALMHATEYISEQIDLIKKLEEKGFTYVTSDGVYFDSSMFGNYFNLSKQNPKELQAGVRIDMGEKKNVSDFALWKFSYVNGRSFDAALDDEALRRQMEWDSPWGTGFPGWHIECSAMAIKALGETLDIHTGGIDHISVHHTNEIAQSESATGVDFVKYWVHHNFLLVDGQKMSKSIGNFYTIQEIVDKEIDPLALRYLYLQTHYRQEMNFTWESLHSAQTALVKLRKEVSVLEDGGVVIEQYQQKFMDGVNEDLNMAKALAVVWEVLKSNNSDSDKKATILNFDEVLGLNVSEIKSQQLEIPEYVKTLVKEREDARKQKDFVKADQLREKIKEKGYEVRDGENGHQEIRKSDKIIL